MSGLTDADDAVSIRVKDKDFKGWETVAVTRSCEMIPNSFQLSASTEFMQGEALAATRPEQPCEILIGGDLVITGWIDRRTITAGPEEHTVTITGRGITRNLVDCSADLNNTPGLKQGQIKATDVLDLAKRLASTWNDPAKGPVLEVIWGPNVAADHGPTIPSLQLSLGETPYQIIESICRYAGFMVYEDEKGRLLLDIVGTKAMASGFAMPGNIETIRAERSTDGRYSHYIVVYNPVGQYLQTAGEKSNLRAVSFDRELEAIEYRPKIIVWPGATPLDTIDSTPGHPDDNFFARRMADYELAHRWGRGQSVSIMADSWRAADGKLWTPNWLASVDAVKADIEGANWIIGTVTYRKDGSGTHADLILMPPEAFNVSPNPLNLFDRQTANPAPVPDSPVPPTP